MITIVSGLPRSGTSLMMQMLGAGGMELLTDEIRKPDENNTKGYFEYEPVKSLQKDNTWMAKAEGKAVKIIAQLLQFLPKGYDYKILMMQRSLQEIIASQKKMLQTTGIQGAKLDDAILIQTFQKQLDRINMQLNQSDAIQCLAVSYSAILANPHPATDKIQSFLNIDLNITAMSSVVDMNLWHQRH